MRRDGHVGSTWQVVDPNYQIGIRLVAGTENRHTSTHRAEQGYWFPFGPRFLVINDAPFPRWLKLMLITFLARFPSGFRLLTAAAGNFENVMRTVLHPV
jgi:hypothetical protein